MYDENNDFQEENDIDIKDVLYSQYTEDTPDLDETPLPFYLQNMFATKRTDSQLLLIDHGDKERGNWDTQFEYLLSCIGYAVGLGNLWRFPAKVYQGGGGAFLIPYLSLCLLFGGPMMMLEMSLGQFCGQGCSKAFEFSPLLQGIGWTIGFMAFLILVNYTIVIAWCLFYLVSSFRSPLPWSICSNSFNTPRCINTSTNIKNFTNVSLYESSTVQFWNLYVTAEQRRDGSFYKITDPLGSPNLPCSICMLAVLGLAALTIMFGVKVSGKIIYLTVIFPYIAILQFIILGCTLPGALNGIKYYLYPDASKLLEPRVYLSALEQLLFSSGIAAGGLITMSSFNRFRDRIQRNVLIVMFTDFFTSFISGFATFPVLGYMSYRSGKHIKDLVKADSSLFFITYPEALATISSSNLWSVLFMFMALTLGIDSLFVLLETVTMAISDYFPILHLKRYKIALTISVCLITFFFALIFITPGGLNWISLFESNVTPFVLTLTVLMEVFSICVVYGIRNFQKDVELMTGKPLGWYWVITICVFVPIGATVILIIDVKHSKTLIRYDVKFPEWTMVASWLFNLAILSPVFIGALIVLIKYKIKNPSLSLVPYLKLCKNPPPHWGPKSKRYWVQSSFYSKKLIQYKDDPILLASLAKEENIEKLVFKSEKQSQKAKIKP